MTAERILLVFPDAGDGRPGWALVVPGGVAGHGVGLTDLPAGAEGATIVLAAPGDRVALHWLDLPPELAPAQAAAAATLMLSAKLLQTADMVHVAVGGIEGDCAASALSPKRSLRSGSRSSSRSDFRPTS